MSTYTPPRCRHVITPTGIVIGGAYTRPAHRMDRDHEQVQAAMLEPRTAHAQTPLQRIAGRVWRWL